MEDCIYLDYNASTPIDPAVLQAMQNQLSKAQVNAGSITHKPGREAHDLLENARAQVAASLHAEPRDIIFCGSATEGINIALLGMARQYAARGKHIICSSAEHRAVLAVMDQLQAEGFEITRLAVDEMGYVNPDDVSQAIRPDTIVCAMLHVNNETGTIQDIAAIADRCAKQDVRFFVDAAQSWGKLPLNLQETPIDALVCTAHKAYGPQGIAALYVRRKPKRLRLQPCLYGGGQERSLRPGTVPVVLAYAMGFVAELNQQRMKQDLIHLQRLREHALALLEDLIPDVQINGDKNSALANTINFQIPGRDAQDLLCSLPECALAMGSACSASIPQPSHVLRAMGLSWQAAASSIRMSYGRMTTFDDISACIKLIANRIPNIAVLAEE